MAQPAPAITLAGGTGDWAAQLPSICVTGEGRAFEMKEGLPCSWPAVFSLVNCGSCLLCTCSAAVELDQAIFLKNQSVFIKVL